MKVQKLDIPIEEYTTPCLAQATPETPLEKIRQEMASYGVRHIPILKDQKIVGIISDRDLQGVMNLEVFDKLVADDIMTDEPYTVSLGTSMEDVIYDLSQNKWGSALILDENNELYGVFTTTDAMNALLEILRGDDVRTFDEN